MTESYDAGLTAIVAHRLLNSMAVVVGIAETVYVNDEALGRARRLELVALLGREADQMSGMLQDLVRGLPPGTTEAGARGHGDAWWAGHEDVRLRRAGPRR